MSFAIYNLFEGVISLRIGGLSYKNGINFYGDKFTVASRIKKDGVQEINIEMIDNNIISKIPMLRRYFSSLKSTLLSIYLLILFIIIDFHSNKNNELGILLYIFFVLLIIWLCIFQNKKFTGFHGAEHKAINAYYFNKDISVENINKSSRIARQCGTNGILIIVFIMIISNIVFREFYFTILFITYGLTRELFTLKNFDKYPFFYIAFKFGDFLQDKFRTSEPTEEQLDLAKNAIEKLIYCEENAYNIVSISEANQKFPEMDQLLDENKAIIILKNNAPEYVLVKSDILC